MARPISGRSGTVKSITLPAQYGISIQNSQGRALPSGECTFSITTPMSMSEMPSKILLNSRMVPTRPALMQATSV